jgi:anti-sigma factor ChrR (cupin superfamily)
MTEIEELVALDAAGALSEVERTRLHDQLQRADGHVRAAAADVYSAAEALAASLPLATPRPQVRDALLARLRASLSFIPAEEGWQPHRLPGVTFKILSDERQRGYVTMLMRVPAGTVYPAHGHEGPEECYVIAGDVTVAGRRMGPGDFHHADRGTRHDTLTTEHGATVLLVVNAADYLHDT